MTDSSAACGLSVLITPLFLRKRKRKLQRSKYISLAKEGL